jgi:hypothetical protein
LAARTNLEILESYNYDLQAILLKDTHSPLCPGSEFCPTAILDPVLQGHPLWARAKKTLMHGVHLLVEPIEEEPRLQDLLEAIEIGNHKSATKDGPKLLLIFGKEVEKGWQLTLPIFALKHLPGGVVGPVGMIVSQDSINAFGHRLPKDQPVHDQLSSFGSGQLLNNRVPKTSSLRVDTVLRSFDIFTKIAALRAIYPAARILLSKIDIKSAYRCVHFRAESALQSCITTKGLGGIDLALVSLRTTFGRSPCPSIFSEISETATDLTNTIIRCSNFLFQAITVIYSARPRCSRTAASPYLKTKSSPSTRQSPKAPRRKG